MFLNEKAFKNFPESRSNRILQFRTGSGLD